MDSSYSSENDSDGFSHSVFRALTSSKAIFTTTVTRYRDASWASVRLAGCSEIDVIWPRTIPSTPSSVGTTV